MSYVPKVLFVVGVYFIISEASYICLRLIQMLSA